MAQGKKALTRLDQMLDELIGENPQPEDILGEDRLHPYTKIRTLSSNTSPKIMVHLWVVRLSVFSIEA